MRAQNALKTHLQEDSFLKSCSVCGVAKPEIDFHNDRSSSDGLHHRCKPCQKAYRHEYYLDNKQHEIELAVNWKRRFPERARAHRKKWVEQHSKQVNESKRKWRNKNRDKLLKTGRDYYHKNKDKLLAVKRISAEKIRRFNDEHPELFKKCSCCGELKPLPDFRFNQCKECETKKQKERDRLRKLIAEGPHKKCLHRGDSRIINSL